MGVLNLTPDSFSDGGSFRSIDPAIEHAFALEKAGAHVLDIGGESSRPGSEPVDQKTEWDRVGPVLKELNQANFPLPISLDTYKPEIAQKACDIGVDILNDISGLSNPKMAHIAAANDTGIVLMHIRGEPKTMQQGSIHYDNIVDEVIHFLGDRSELALGVGVQHDRLWLDPGIGFGKTLKHNLTLTAAIESLCNLGFPILFGPSRKRFLGEITGRDVSDRDRATAAVCALGYLSGATIFRVHNLPACTDALRVASALKPFGKWHSSS